MAKLDKYVFWARLAPAALVLLPVALAASAWLKLDLLSMPAAATSLAWLALSAALAQWTRDPGKMKEPGLFQAWGGKPSTQLLRHANRELNQRVQERYRAALRRLIPDLSLPTAAQEAADTALADEAYDAAVEFLKEKTRDRDRFRVLFSELVSYGFRRNLWGLRRIGVVVALVGVAAAVGAAWSQRTATAVAVALLSAVLTVFWLVVVNPDWVRLVAFEYAKRLLASLDDLAPPSTPDPFRARAISRPTRR